MDIGCQLFIFNVKDSGCFGDFVDINKSSSNKSSYFTAICNLCSLSQAEEVVDMFGRSSDLFFSDNGIDLECLVPNVLYQLIIGVHEIHYQNLKCLVDEVNKDFTINPDKIAKARALKIL